MILLLDNTNKTELICHGFWLIARQIISLIHFTEASHFCQQHIYLFLEKQFKTINTILFSIIHNTPAKPLRKLKLVSLSIKTSIHWTTMTDCPKIYVGCLAALCIPYFLTIHCAYEMRVSTFFDHFLLNLLVLIWLRKEYPL